MSRLDGDSNQDDLLSEIGETISASVSIPQTRDMQKSALFTYLSRAYMLDVLHAFALDSGPWRFNELRDRLDVPPTTLTNRLQELTDTGFVRRESYDEIPPRVEYTATEKLLDFGPVFGCLGLWIDKHGWDPEDAQTSNEMD